MDLSVADGCEGARIAGLGDFRDISTSLSEDSESQASFSRFGTLYVSDLLVRGGLDTLGTFSLLLNMLVVVLRSSGLERRSITSTGIAHGLLLH